MAGVQLFLLLLLGLSDAVRAVRDVRSDADLMPGWMGSDYQPPELTPDSLKGRTQRMKVLHEDARIYYFEGFLSPEECDEIVKQATPRLAPVGVVSVEKSDQEQGTRTETSKIRTSWGMFFARGENDLIKAVEQRIASWTLLPAYNGEGMQVLRYENTQKYEPHWDYFFHKDGTSNGGNRAATVLSYLSDVEEGGETVFPFIPAPGGENEGFSECARKYLAVKPKKGDAILFHSMRASGLFEKRSMHGACPVIKGTKFSMARWIHVDRYAYDGEPHTSILTTVNVTSSAKPECEDTAEFASQCSGWSMTGECYKNDVWMVGTAEKPGHCLLSCLRCDVWKAHLALSSTTTEHDVAVV